MNEQITLNYGGSTVTFAKSDSLLALKKDANRPTERSVNAPPPISIGDYEVLSMQEERSLNPAENTPPNLEGASNIFHFGEDNLPLIPTGELYIEFEAGANYSDCLTLIRQHNLSILQKRPDGSLVVGTSARSLGILSKAAELQASDLIAVAEPDFQMPIAKHDLNMPTEDLLARMWHLKNKGQHGSLPSVLFKTGADAKVIQAWEHMDSLGDDDLVVAVIDDGFDLNHPDLKGNGNKIVSPWSFKKNNANPTATSGQVHGTPCASVAVGASNGLGVVGAAPACKLMPLQFHTVSDKMVEDYFNYCIDNGADIVSCSWGINSPSFVLSTRMINAITKAATEGREGKGCVILFAAGNDTRNISGTTEGEIRGFATHPDVIGIAASNSKDQRSNYSNYGKEISIAAPSNGGGAGIVAADILGASGYTSNEFNVNFGGTSSSCPLAAGVAALVLSANPNLTAVEVKSILETTTDKIDGGKAPDNTSFTSSYDSNGHSIYFGYGRINALEAVKKAQAAINKSSSDNDNNDNNNGTIAVPITIQPPNGGGLVTPTLSIQQVPLRAKAIGSSNLGNGMDKRLFKIKIPRKLVLTLQTSNVNDYKVYLKKEGMPSVTQNDKISKKNAKGNQVLAINNVSGGEEYFVMVDKESGAGKFKLIVLVK